MDDGNIAIKWKNLPKTGVCRVAFASNEEVWVLERDILWDHESIYGMVQDRQETVTAERARKLWKLLATDHDFYDPNIELEDE